VCAQEVPAALDLQTFLPLCFCSACRLYPGKHIHVSRVCRVQTERAQPVQAPDLYPVCVRYVSMAYPSYIQGVSIFAGYHQDRIALYPAYTQCMPSVCPMVSRVVFGWCVQFVSIIYPGCLHARRSPTCADRVSTVYPICTHGVSSVCLVVSVRDVPMFPRRRLRCVLMLYPWCIHDVSRVYPERTHPLVCPPNVVSRACTWCIHCVSSVYP
jgi:hypothetical protein